MNYPINVSTTDDVLKNFYSLSEYYNFLKIPNNSVTPQRLFSIVPHPEKDTLHAMEASNAETGRMWKDGNGYTKAIFSNSNLKRFVMSVQKLNLPNFNMQQGDIKSSVEIATPIGAWRTLDNTTSFTRKN